MDAERKIYINEDHPLNAPGATKIYLNAGKNRKINSPSDGTVIHLNTGKQADLGLHLNTTFSIASSKKIKLLFLLNFLLSLVCMVICFFIACYYWQELSSLRRQIDTMKDHLLIQNMNQEKVAIQNSLERSHKVDQREPRTISENSSLENAKKFFVEDLGDDLLFLDSKKKNQTNAKHSIASLATMPKEILISQFNGADSERNMSNEFLIGPWERDVDVSSKNSKDKIEMNEKSSQFVFNEGGIYLIYAQISYLSHAPNGFTIWQQSDKSARQLTLCSSGDDSTKRLLSKSYISCAVQTIARLSPGDIVTMQQKDNHRTLVLKPGYSYIGFVRLSP